MALQSAIGTYSFIPVSIVNNVYVCFLLIVYLFTYINLPPVSTNNRIHLIRNKYKFKLAFFTITEQNQELNLYKMNVCVDSIQLRFFVLMTLMVHRLYVLESQPKVMVHLHCSTDSTETKWNFQSSPKLHNAQKETYINQLWCGWILCEYGFGRVQCNRWKFT